MKIAVATEDWTSISAHFGRSAGFIIFDIDNGIAKRQEQRENIFTAHSQGKCGHGHESGEHHSHEAITNALKDCQAVICHGMGQRAFVDLEAKGIKAIIVAEDLTAEAAAQKYAKGGLDAVGGSPCCGHH
jgi:predicted Fe-Mo cluster-binding NifX family protein